MKPAEQWRLGLARFITQFYARQPGVSLALLGGSMAEGTADAYSDMDVFIYWDDLDSAWLDSHMPLREVAGVRLSSQLVWQGRAFLEQYVVGHLRIDIEHIALMTWQAAAQATLEDLTPAPETQIRLAGFQRAQVLHGAAVFESWRERLATYPPGLAASSIAYHLAFLEEQWAQCEQSVARADQPALAWALTNLTQHVLGALAGLNQRFLPAPHLKRLGYYVAQMPLSPPNSAERLPQLFTLNPPDAALALEAYLHELIQLVETHRPDVDTRPARRALHLEEADVSP